MKLGDLGFGGFEFGPGEAFHPFYDDLLEVVQVSLLNEHHVSERCWVGLPSPLTWRVYVSMAAPASGLWRRGYLSPTHTNTHTHTHTHRLLEALLIHLGKKL